MKIYFNSDFIITKREYEEYYLGSEYHNKIEIYFPMTTYGNYTYIYPVFNVKRPDDRKFGEFALTEYNVENDYIVWSADLPAKALEVEGALEITIIFKYSTDNKYAKVSTGKVLLNVKEAVIGEENDVIFTGSGDNLQGEIDAIRNEFGVRFNNVETRYISDLAELDNYKTPGIYRFNYNNANVFDLYITRTYQIRSSSNGYYRRSYNSNDGFGEWIFNEYNVNGSTQWNSEIQYSKGDIVRNNAVYVCINDNKGYDPEEDDENNPLYWIKFEPENYVLKEEGKGLSTNDLTDSLLAKLNSLKNYDDTAINNKITAIERILASDNVDLDTLQEIVDVLEENEGDINAIFTAIAKKVDKDGLKTVNGQSLIGSGNIEIKGGSGNVIDLGLVENNTPYPLPEGKTIEDFINADAVEITTPILYQENTLNAKVTLYKSGNVQGMGALFSTVGMSKYFELSVLSEGYSLYVHDQPTTWWVEEISSYQDRIFYRAYEGGKSNTYEVYGNKIKLNGTTYEPFDFNQSEVIDLDNAGLLKNNDIKKDTYFSSTYKSYNLYGQGTGEGYSGFSLSEHSINLSNTKNGNSSIYLGGGNISIYSDNDVTINTKSFNKLYEDVQLLKGNYDLIYPSSGTDYQVSIASSHEKYAMVSKIGGMSYKVNGEIQHTKITDVKLNNNIVIDLSSLQSMEGYGYGINENCYNYLDFDKDVLVRRVGSYTFNGGEGFTQGSTNSGKYRYAFDLLRMFIKPVQNNEMANVMMLGFETAKSDDVYMNKGELSVGSNGQVYFYKENVQTVNDMKNYLKGKTLYFEYLNPIENAIPPIDTFIDVSSGGRFTFENENQQAVPYEIKYIKVV